MQEVIFSVFVSNVERERNEKNHEHGIHLLYCILYAGEVEDNDCYDLMVETTRIQAREDPSLLLLMFSCFKTEGAGLKSRGRQPRLSVVML